MQFSSIIDDLAELLTRADTAIVLSLNHPLAFEHGQLFLELVAQVLVGMGVGEEDGWQGIPQVGWALRPVRADSSQALGRPLHGWFN